MLIFLFILFLSYSCLEITICFLDQTKNVLEDISNAIEQEEYNQRVHEHALIIYEQMQEEQRQEEQRQEEQMQEKQRQEEQMQEKQRQKEYIKNYVKSTNASYRHSIDENIKTKKEIEYKTQLANGEIDTFTYQTMSDIWGF